MLTTLQRQQGVTLIELMIGIAIVGLLVMVALPNFRAWQQGTMVRNAAESILNGMQVARTAAVQRNTTVQFVLTAGSTSDWTVSQVTNPPPAEVAAGIQQHSSLEGAKTAAVTAVDGAGAATATITFNGMGWVVVPTNNDGSKPIDHVDVGPGQALGDTSIRTLRIVIGSGGTTRMCDPGGPGVTPKGPNATDLPVGDGRRC